MLKKIAILTAAAGMLSTSMAVLAEGPTVYGRVAFGFKSISGETDADDSQRIDDHLGSRLGVKGTNDLGNGTSVDYLLEYGAGESLGLRHSNMSLNGSFGQFRLGKQTGVLYRYTGSNSDQSWALGGDEWYAIAGKDSSMNSNHSLRMTNIAAYRFGAGPGGDDPITFDIQIQGKDMSKEEVAEVESFYTGVDDHGNPVAALVKEDAASFKAELADLGIDIPDAALTTLKTDLTAQGKEIRRTTNADDVAAAKDDDKTIDSVTIGAATSLGPVKFQLAYVDENGSEATGDKSPNLLSLGFRAPLGSAEIRGHMTEVNPDDSMRDDDEAWGLLVMNDFGGGYFGMIGVGNYTDGGKGKMHEKAMRGGLYAKTQTGVSDDAATDADETRSTEEISLVQTDSDGTAEYYNAVTGNVVTVDANTTTAGEVQTGDIVERDYVAEKKGVHKDAGDMTNLYVSLTKSFGGGLSAIAEYSTNSTTVTKADGVDDDKETTNKFLLSLMQTF